MMSDQADVIGLHAQSSCTRLEISAHLAQFRAQSLGLARLHAENLGRFCLSRCSRRLCNETFSLLGAWELHDIQHAESSLGASADCVVDIAFRLGSPHGRDGPNTFGV